MDRTGPDGQARQNLETFRFETHSRQGSETMNLYEHLPHRYHLVDMAKIESANWVLFDKMCPHYFAMAVVNRQPMPLID